VGGRPAQPPHLAACRAAQRCWRHPSCGPPPTSHSQQELPPSLPHPETPSPPAAGPGPRHVEAVAHAVEQRTLVLAGALDLLLPSQREGERLARLLPRAFCAALPARSHLLLCEPGFDLVSEMQRQGFYAAERRCAAGGRHCSCRRQKGAEGQPPPHGRPRRPVRSERTAQPLIVAKPPSAQ
jgi:hypothetical protein